jgi:hypothetical protein
MACRLHKQIRKVVHSHQASPIVNAPERQWPTRKCRARELSEVSLNAGTIH